MIVYGHYDVQPPGPAELWTSPPFEPVVRDGNLYARGASDDKGNLFMLIAAVQRLAAAGELPVRGRFVVEEEESGGTSALEHFAADPGPALAVLIFDSPMIAPGRPTLCTGVRGHGLPARPRADGRRRRPQRPLRRRGYERGARADQILGAVMPRDGRLPDALYAGVAPAGAGEVGRLESCRPAPRRSPTRGCAPPTPARPTASTCARSPRRRSTSTGSPAASRARSRRSSRPRRPRPCRCGSPAARTPTPWPRPSTA